MRGPDVRTTARARRLRRTDNDAESKLWLELRDRRLGGYKFVRQLPIGPYFADFACRGCLLVVEIDGSQHAQNRRDQVRDNFMVSEGWSVLRIWNVDVLKECEQVLETILAAIEGRLEREVSAFDLRFVSAADYGVNGEKGRSR
jgi:very-short-patch-repair endonuclease